MSKSDVFETDWLKLIFQAIAIPGLADNAASGTVTTLPVALHTADPGEAGTQLTSEAAYTGYARVNVPRTTGGWTVTAGSGATPASVSPVAVIDFGECLASPGSPITHWSVGTGVANKLLYSGTVSPIITMAVNVIPRLKTTSTITED